MNRRRFLQQSAALSALAGTRLRGQPGKDAGSRFSASESVTLLPDDDWRLWIDKSAAWEDDAIYLPEDLDLATLPIHPPTGGWRALYRRTGGTDFAVVTLPSTVEQHFWEAFGQRPYTPQEYRYADDDPVPQNGAYRGVSWWWRPISIPASMAGKRILLHIRGARMRAEVFLNEQLVGYSIMEELPFECDLTRAALPGRSNRLAIRITNPGGRYDWVDGLTIRWGAVNVYRSHGFGGLDRELTLRAVPISAHLDDSWVLNTPEPTTIQAFARVAGQDFTPPTFQVVEFATGKVLASARGELDRSTKSAPFCLARATLSCPHAQLWDLDSPTLYRLRATLSAANGEQDLCTRIFGFRWFAPSGLGSDAVFRLNGRRIKIYSSISWGFWGINGLWPTPQLAEREVRQAKALGLNCLNFHRNVGKEDVFREHDRLGLLRYMEPGGGKLSIGKLPSGAVPNAAGIAMQGSTNPADLFSQRFMLAKCRAMVRAFRSHPSLIQYTLQNEIGADLSNPETFAPLRIMHQEDPSRSVVLNDGFSPQPRSAPQAWYSPYDDTIHRSDREPWAGWWNNHQGAGDQWYDHFYQAPNHFTYRQPLRTSLVEFGEMEGCAVADDHARMVHQIEARGFGGYGKSYDLADHREILAAYDAFLDRWGFRKAFPTAGHLFSSLGNKCYESWQQYLENVRICDAVDFAVISGWESTAIENHSGIVDNLRNFKGDPRLIASSLRPVRLVAKQHHLSRAVGESAIFDLYLLNETAKSIPGKLRFSMLDPDDKLHELGTWAPPTLVPDQFSYTIHAGFSSQPLTREGIYRFRFTADSAPQANFEREIWVANTRPAFSRPLRIAVSGLLPFYARQLAALPGHQIVPFSPDALFDLIVTSGLVAGSTLASTAIDETGLEPQPKGSPAQPVVPGRISDDVLAAVRKGTSLLVAVPHDALADGVARQLADAGAFTYHGLVGDLRAPWMGCWLFVREHATFAGLPVNRALGVHYQAPGKRSNGLLIDRVPSAPDPEIILAYSRDHDRRIGAASFLCHIANTPVLVHRAPPFSPPLQQRWLANAIAHLTRASRESP
ncbi:MAG: sugar-binding domain-containing protein [Terracidiphilus sp.]